MNLGTLETLASTKPFLNFCCFVLLTHWSPKALKSQFSEFDLSALSVFKVTFLFFLLFRLPLSIGDLRQ